MNSVAIAKLQKKRQKKRTGTGERTPVERHLWVVSLTPLDPFVMRGTNISVTPNNEQMNSLSDAYGIIKKR